MKSLSKAFTCLGLVIAFCSTFNASAGERPLAGEFSIGIAAIAPNGVTAKYWLSTHDALDIFGEWSINSKEYIFHFNYVRHDFDQYNWEGETVGLYYGFGVRVKTKEDEDVRVGARVPIGVNYFLSNAPVELFAEVAPIVNLIPSTNFGGDIMVGGRFRFMRKY